MKKILDWRCKGNVIRLYYGDEDTEEWYGDDWDDRPYEHNAGIVYDRFVRGYIDIAVGFDYDVLEPKDDFRYNGNSPFCKEDFVKRKAPILLICDLGDNTFDEYNTLVGSDNDNIVKVYMGDDIDALVEDNYQVEVLSV